EWDGVPLGRPRERARAGEQRAGEPDLARRVDDLELAVVVPALRAVDEGEELPVRGDADLIDPPGRLVEDLADRILEAAPVADDAADREALPVGRPVGSLGALEDLAGRAAREWHARERPRGLGAHDEVPVERARDLAGRGDGQHDGTGQTERS